MLAVLAVLTRTIFSVKICSFIYIDPIGQFLIDEQNFFGCEEKKKLLLLCYITYTLKETPTKNASIQLKISYCLSINK